MHRFLIPILAVFMISAEPALSANDQKIQSPSKNPEQMIEESVKTVMNALKQFLRSIPQYSAPEILDNGDIIIRRKHRENEPGDQKKKEPGQTDT